MVSSPDIPNKSATRWLVPLLTLLALCGLGLNLLLFWWKASLPAGGIAGCGGGSGCADVLASRWSQVFGVPVTVPGAMVYGMVLAALAAGWGRVLACGVVTLLGGSLWFILVQALLLGRFCPWCMAAHGVGLVVFTLGVVYLGRRPDYHALMAGPAIAGMMATLLLAGLQIFGPVPATHRVENAAAVGAGGASAGHGIHAAGSGRKATFADGRKVFDVAGMPRLGKPEARHVLVEYFDYQCPACRFMRGFLEELVVRHPDEICVLVLPVPLEEACNPRLDGLVAQHPGSCHLARLALALWREEPEAFPEVHRAFFADPAPSDFAARALVEKHLGPERLDAALGDEWIGRVLEANAADWAAFSKNTPALPKLLIKGNRILHGLPSGREEFIRVMEKELGVAGGE